MSAGLALRDRLALAVAALVAWQLAALVFGAHWVPSPLVTGRRFVQLVATGELLRHSLFTLAAAGAAFSWVACPARSCLSFCAGRRGWRRSSTRT